MPQSPGGNASPTTASASASHPCLSLAVLVTTTENIRRRTSFTPQRSKTQRFQIASSGSPKSPLPGRGRVGGVQDDGGLRAQEPDRHPFARVALLELVGDTWPNDAIDPAGEDRRGLAPPVRVDDDDSVRRGEVVGVAPKPARERGVLRDLGSRKIGSKPSA